MARILVTGSTSGIGLLLGRFLLAKGHAVVLHARDGEKAAAVRSLLPGAEAVVVGDLSTVSGMRQVADAARAIGSFDAVIHNAALGYREPRRAETVDGLSQLWAVNVLAPYVLTALIPTPRRLVYTGSGMHLSASADLTDLQFARRTWDGAVAYAESKLHVLLLARAVARRYPAVPTNTVSPGWVATRMGGPGAPGDLQKSHLTQAWLAVSDDPAALRSGGFIQHQRSAEEHPEARGVALQERLLDICAIESGIVLP